MAACARARGKCNQTTDTYTFKQSKILQIHVQLYPKIITEIKSTILLLYTNNTLTHKTNL
jgi:hypothetical protein